MNVDLLENNPSWTTYFYFAAPMFALIMLAVLLLKRKGLFLSCWRYLFQIFRAQAMKDGECSDLEKQGGSRFEAAGTAGDQVTFLWAAKHGSRRLLELQISRGIEIEGRSSDGRTALQLASGCGHMSIVSYLLRKGAEVNAPASTPNGRTALQAAAGCGNLPLVEHLLAEGAEVNAPGSWEDGRTALQAAAGGGHLPIVERLLMDGAEVNAPASRLKGRTALQAAAEHGHMPIVERLLKDGAEVNAPASGWKGRTALQAAAGGGHLPIDRKSVV